MSHGKIKTAELGSRQPIAWVCLVFFSACALFAWLANEPGPALVLALFAALGVVLLRSRSNITLDAQGITLAGRFSTHHMQWSDIEQVQTDGVTLVLAGGKKRLPIAPRFWAPENGDAARVFLETQLAARNIPRIDNPLASRAMPRHTRIKARRAA